MHTALDVVFWVGVIILELGLYNSAGLETGVMLDTCTVGKTEFT